MTCCFRGNFAPQGQVNWGSLNHSYESVFWQLDFVDPCMFDCFEQSGGRACTDVVNATETCIVNYFLSCLGGFLDFVLSFN